jgi:hypothetical protein
MLGTSPAARGQKEVRLAFRPRDVSAVALKAKAEAGEVSKARPIATAYGRELETEGVARESAQF